MRASSCYVSVLVLLLARLHADRGVEYNTDSFNVCDSDIDVRSTWSGGKQGDSPNISFNQQIKDLKDNTREPLSIKCGAARSELSGRVQPDRARVFSIAEATRFNRDLYRGVIYKFRENANNRFYKALLWLRESFANLPSLKGADKALRKIREQFRVLVILLYCGDSSVINEDGKSVSYLESFGIRTVSEAVRVINFNFFT